MNKAETFTLGLVLGAGATYLFDPERGSRRRALLRDQAIHAGHELDDAARAGVRHVRNRAVGLAHEAKAGLTEGSVDDTVLVERVRSALGRKVSNATAVEVSAADGRVTLSGTVHPREVQELVRTVRSVRGVDHVESRLHVEQDPVNAPDLQGTRTS
jgi:osmotically-inducible protein OsmY